MIGSQLGPYRLDRELGSGGMGRVYAASVSKTAAGLPCGTRVALKIVHPHLLESGGYFKRFLQEAQIGRAVRHPNVVRTLDVDAFVQGGVQFHVLVMEFVEGQTLRALLDEMERVPEGLCRHVGRETAAGLAAIHAAGAVHRDLKPENVLITPDHQIKIMDLGVARLRDETVRLSRTGAIAGSLLYAAPEQFGSEGRADPRADLHALGVLLYELAAGVHPFLADDSAAVMHRIVHEEPPRLGDRNTQVSPFLEEVVHRLLEKDPERRFSSAAEVARVLEEGEGSPWWTERAKHLRRAAGRPLRRVRIPRETAVHGREAELAALRGLYSKAVAGEGQVVLLEGEAGVGKTRLVDEFAGRLQREGEDLSFLHGSYPPSGAATAAGALSTAYREQFGEEGSASWLARVPLLVPAFDALLRGDAPPPGAEPLTRESVASCFVHATAALAAERPTVILVDDLHFAPEEARGLFAALAAA
ncbi:MAG: protein kinase, partial [Planctomycetaceae bacterium]|nr:protein kinase [Planctomycetaceae bacterium]